LQFGYGSTLAVTVFFLVGLITLAYMRALRTGTT
jgi:ABC-type sugar transport system permease subunit